MLANTGYLSDLQVKVPTAMPFWEQTIEQRDQLLNKGIDSILEKCYNQKIIVVFFARTSELLSDGG
jgi:hypothetical protein